MGILTRLWASVSSVASSVGTRTKSVGTKLWSKMIGIASLGYPGSWSADRTIQAQKFTGWNYVGIMAVAEEVACQRPKIVLRHDPDDPELANRRRNKSIKLLTINQRRKSFVHTQTDEELEPVGSDHPLLRLLCNPNPPDTCETFWIRTVIYLRLTGNCYWWIVRNNVKSKLHEGRGLPAELWCIPSQWVWPKYGGPSGNIIEYYEIRPYGLGMSGAQWIKIAPEDMVVFQYPGPIHPFDGYSPIQATAQWTDEAQSIDISRFAQFKNNGWPGMVVELDASMNDADEAEIEAFRAKLMAVAAGERNSGKIFIVPQGTKVTPQTRTALEMDYVQSFDQMRDAVLSTHRVGKSIVGIAEGVNFASMAAARANFIYSTVRPLVMLIDGVITEKLAPEFSDRLLVYHDDKAPDDPSQKLAEWNAAFDRGCAAPNEYRKNVLGLEPYEHGGDDPLVNMSLSVMPLATGSDGIDLSDMPAATAVRYEHADVQGTTQTNKPGMKPGEGATAAGSPVASDETPGTPAGQPAIQQTPERAELLSTVGGITGAIDIISKVAAGELSRESAKHLMVLFFGIKEVDAEKLLGPAAKPTEEGGGQPSGGNGKAETNGHAKDDGLAELFSRTNTVRRSLGKTPLVGKAEWDEADHPRADDGKFGSGGGSHQPSANAATKERAKPQQSDSSESGKTSHKPSGQSEPKRSTASEWNDDDLNAEHSRLSRLASKKGPMQAVIQHELDAVVSEIERRKAGDHAADGPNVTRDYLMQHARNSATDADPLKLLDKPVTGLEADVYQAFVDIRQQKENPFQSPTVAEVARAVMQDRGASVRDVQTAFVKLMQDGKVELGAYTQALATIPDADVQHVIPLGREPKYYVRPGQSVLATAEQKAADFDESQHPRAADGKFGSGGGAAAGDSSHSQPTSDKHKEHRQHVVAHLMDQAKQLGHAAGDVASKLGHEVWKKLPAKVQRSLAKTYAIAKVIEHKAMAAFTVGKELASEVAKQRGLPDTHADKVARVCGVVDQCMAWTTTGPATLAATGSMTAAKVASLLPVASLAYVAYSSSRNPFATARAARHVIAKHRKGTLGHKSMRLDDDEIAALLAGYEAASGSDWYDALLHAALDETDGDVTAAVKLANDAIAEQAEEPSDLPEGRQNKSEPAAALTLPDIRQAENYDCGAAALHSCCRYFGVGPVSQEEFVELLGTNAVDGTRINRIVALAKELGLAVDAREGLSVDDLQSAAAAGSPVICCMQSAGDPDGNKEGHYVAVVGVTDNGVAMQDPVDGPTEMDRAEWERRWHDQDGDGKIYERHGIILSKPGE